MIVKCLHLHSARNGLANLFELLRQRIHHRHSVAFWLPEDIQQHRRLAVRRDQGVNRHYRIVHGRNVADSDRHAGWREANHDIADLRRILNLAAHKRQCEFMIVLDQSRRVNHIAFGDRIQNGGYTHLRLQQFSRIGLYLKLGNLPALYHNGSYSVYAVQPRLDCVVSQFPKLRLWHGIGTEAVSGDGKRGKRQPVRCEFGCGRKRGLYARQRRVHRLQRLEHVYVPVEK